MGLFRTVDPATPAVYEGQASLSAIAEAARQTALLADNTNARYYAEQKAFDDAIKTVRDETGIELENPHLVTATRAFNRMPVESDAFADWETRISDIAEQHPDKAELLNGLTLQGVRNNARTKAREASQDFGRLSETRDDWPGFFAGIYGGFQGAFRDPVTLAVLPLGLGAGTARTFGGKVLSTAWREALLNGSTELAVQPIVQKWRAEAGLPAGLEEAARNVGMAMALGGVFGAGVRGAVELPGTIRRQLARRPDPRIQAPDPEKIVDDLIPVRDELPPATRAAVDVVDQERAVMRAIREELGEELGPQFAETLQRADRFADRLELGDPEDFTRFLRDQELAQDQRLANDFNAARETLDQAERVLADLEEPLKRRTLADTLEEIDPPSAARVRDIEAELSGDIPTARRADLEGERDLIAGSVGEGVLARTEREFRIGPEKQIKRARKKVREARKDFNAVRREVDSQASARLEAGRAARASDPAPVDQAQPGTPNPDTTAPGARASTADPFEPDSKEFAAQVDDLVNQIDPEDELVDLITIDEDGRITASGRTVAEALDEADRGQDLSNLVEACKLS